MSAKWRALQHRHRYTYSFVVFPVSFLHSLVAFEGSIASERAETAGEAADAANLVSVYAAKFLVNLKHMASLNTMYAQVAAAKDVSSSFVELLTHADEGLPAELVSAASGLYVEILFLENSLPLHRTLISTLAKSRKSLPVVESCLLSLFRQYGRLGREGKMRFSVSRAVLSLMGYPKLGFLNGVIEGCARLVAEDVAVGLNRVIADVDLGSRPSPAVMEQCQDAMSCLYYVLQRFPSKFAVSLDEVEEEKSSNAFEMVLRAILCILRSSAFSRDCLVAAGVSFFAGLQAHMNAQELAAFIAWGFFGIGDGQVVLHPPMLLDDGELLLEIKGFSVLSRICLFRGMLTAAARTVLNTRFVGPDGQLLWTILYNGILPDLCYYCENPVDSHFNFHVLTVTQICLQQVKTSLTSNITDFSDHYDPFPVEITSRLLRIMWNNLEDPLNQTVKQVHLIFDLFLDIKSALLSGESSEAKKLFLNKIASDLNFGARCKGRYVPLASLVRRLGAKAILEMKDKLIFETVSAYMDDDVCCAATTFLKCFLECLRDECWNSDGIEQGYRVFREICLPPLLDGLLSGISKLRSNLSTYAIPTVLDIDVDSIFYLLASVSVGPFAEENNIQKLGAISWKTNEEVGGTKQSDITNEQRVAVLVSLLKVSRQLALVEGDIDLDHNFSSQSETCNDAVICVKGITVKVPVVWFEQALTHVDETLRIDAAESLFLNPKAASLPSKLELKLMREVIPLNMRCSSTAFQMKWTSLFRKFFSRVRTALERQVKQGWQPSKCLLRSENGFSDDNRNENVQRAMDLFSFMKWLSNFLLCSCYPSAPYERKTMAMGLLLIMLDVWHVVPLLQEHTCVYPYNEEFTSPSSTSALVGCIIDSWDRLRESSFRILLHFPSPLPGMFSYESVKKVISWAKKLVCSPRVRESDAGALTLRLIFKKYVLENEWMVGVSTDIVCSTLQFEDASGVSQITNSQARSPVVHYILSMIDWLRDIVEEGERDLYDACRNCFVHGVLLTLRYTFEELDWNLLVESSDSSEMRSALKNLLDLVTRITSLALWVVAADAWYLPDESDDMVGDEGFFSDMSVEVDPDSSLESVEQSSPGNGQRAQQVVMVGCWLAMKEVSLLLGTIVRKVPLPSCTFYDSSFFSIGTSGDLQATDASTLMLDLRQLEHIGDHFLQVLLKMKHNGAIDKTRAGFAALCNRLLCSNDPRLCKMTESWMEKLMERTIAKGQTVDDLLRRSAGIPAAFMALFLSEPEGTPKKLLPVALRWIIDLAKRSLFSSSESCNASSILLTNESSGNLNHLSVQSLTVEGDPGLRTSKMRCEGVIPTVHAFNVLRAAFNDANLAADTSGFCAEAMIISISSFSSPYWEVRNSACLAYTALLRRMIGFLNVQRRESARRALTGLEFFHRYPALHAFIFDRLKIATEMLTNGLSESSESNITRAIHPSLCPILILLSRLKPSIIGSDVNDALDPFLFMPFIRKCATQSNLQVRTLASKALTGLVSNEKLPTVIRGVAEGLSCASCKAAKAESGFHISVSSKENEDSEATMSCSVSFNAIHGILVQLNSLFDVNCRNLNDISKKVIILHDMIQVIWKCSWIGSFRQCPCPTLVTSFLQVLENMLDIARMCKSDVVGNIQALLQKLSSECLDMKEDSRFTFYDPTIVEVQKQATKSFFSCFCRVSNIFEENISQQTPFFASNLFNMHKSEGLLVGQEEKHENDLPAFEEKILLCISDSSHEVRLVMLKLLLQFVKSTNSNYVSFVVHSWAKENLQSLLIKILENEENPKCINYLLRNIFSWNLLHFVSCKHLHDQNVVHIGTLDCDSVLSLWEKLVSLAHFVRHSKTKEIILCCMSLCIRRFRLLRNDVFIHQLQVEDRSNDGSLTDEPERGERIHKCIDNFVILVKQHTAPSEPVNMRKAAAESIVASGLLEEVPLLGPRVHDNWFTCEELPTYKMKTKHVSIFEMSKATYMYGCRVLDAWFTCIQLLEDEDIGLRQKLAKDVQSCINSCISKQKVIEESVPLQVEKVIELSFEFLSSVFGHTLEYIGYLMKWVLQIGDYEVTHANLVRQVFDKEIDNHHEEKMLICQICCSHLERLLSALFQDGADEQCKCAYTLFLCTWKSRFLRKLASFIKDHLKDQSKADWVGGIGNHKDAFMPVYANLLGLYALLQCRQEHLCLPVKFINEDKQLCSEFVLVSEIIRPFLSNPLIANLYWLVMLSFQGMLESSVNVGQKPREIEAWENFDPYFLLK